MHSLFFFFLKDTATTEISTLPLHDALPISAQLDGDVAAADDCDALGPRGELEEAVRGDPELSSRNRRQAGMPAGGDRKSTRLNSSHRYISYAVLCLEKKNNKHIILQSDHHT